MAVTAGHAHDGMLHEMSSPDPVVRPASALPSQQPMAR
jgi:hypothetical protein